MQRTTSTTARGAVGGKDSSLWLRTLDEQKVARDGCASGPTPPATRINHPPTLLGGLRQVLLYKRVALGGLAVVARGLALSL